MNPVLSFLSQLFHPQSTYTYNFRPSQSTSQTPVQPQTPVQTPQPQMLTQAAQPTPPPVPNNLADLVKNGVAARYGADNPILANLDAYMQAGQKLPQGMDPLLPLILALRETQGGKYNVGKNNVFNLRNDTGAFQDYPDLQTAIFGNLDQGGQSGGAVGLLSGTKDSSKGIYQDFRNNPQDLTKLFAHWSPTKDNNGSLQQQVDNYGWIRRHILDANLPNNQ